MRLPSVGRNSLLPGSSRLIRPLPGQPFFAVNVVCLMNRLLRLPLFILLTLFCGFASAAIGYVTEADEAARLIRGDEVFALQAGVAVEQQDIISTQSEGYAQLEMEDGSVLDIGPASQVHLTEYLLDGKPDTDRNGRDKREVDKAEVSLITGWLRFITAKLQPAGRYQFTTPTMTIGIRGTEGIISSTQDDASLSLEEGRVEVAELDSAGLSSAEVTAVKAGEFISRRQGQRRQLLAKTPAAYKDRIPRRYRTKLSRKLNNLQQRGISPRRLRKASYEDLQKILRTNPRIKNRLQNRFKERLKDPLFRKKLNKRLKARPETKRKLRNNPQYNQKKQAWAQKQRKKAVREKKHNAIKRQQKRKQQHR